MADRPLSGASAGNDGQCAGRAQITPERVGVIAAISGEPAKAPRSSRDDLRSHPYIAGVAGREVDDRWAAEDVSDDVDLRRLSAP